MEELKKDITVRVSGTMYKDTFMKLGHTPKNVMWAILANMERDQNIIQMSGHSLNLVSDYCGYNEQVIRNQLRVLYPMLEKTGVVAEYIVNPQFAYKGDEKKCWRMYEKIEDKLKRNKHE